MQIRCAVVSSLLLLWSSVIEGDGAAEAKDLPRFATQMSKEMDRHKNAINMQLKVLDAAASKKDDIAQRLHEVESFLAELNTLSENSDENYNELLTELQLVKRAISETLAGHSAREAQLEERIRKHHQNDPYVESFDHEMKSSWLVIETGGQLRSDWSFEKGFRGTENYAIHQAADVSATHQPATALLLKNKFLPDGFTYTSMLLQGEYMAVSGKGAAGILFKYRDPKNFWMAELGRQSGQGGLTVAEVIESVYNQIGFTPYPIKANQLYKLAVKYMPKSIAVFVDGSQEIEVDLTPSQTYGGTTGLFTRAGKAYFDEFACGPPLFEKLAPSGAFSKDEGKALKTRKVEEKEMKEFMVQPRLQQVKVSGLPSKDNEEVARARHLVVNYEYGPKGAKEKFFPDSPVHVPSRDAVPAKYSGYFGGENSLFRQDPEIIEEVGEVEPPSCFPYSPKRGNVSDWGSATELGWTAVREFGIDRMTTSKAVQPGDINHALLLKGLGCHAATYSVRLRLDSDTEAGLVFRSVDKSNRYVVTLNTKNHLVELKKQEDGTFTTLQSINMGDLHSAYRYNLVVTDHGGKTGFIEVTLDGTPILTQRNERFKGVGGAGMWIQKGHAVFDSFTVN